ncbi:GL18080, partial [Drosophila persimilis]
KSKKRRVEKHTYAEFRFVDRVDRVDRVALELPKNALTLEGHYNKRCRFSDSIKTTLELDNQRRWGELMLMNR